MQMEFSGKSVLITGAGSGIGRAMAVAFAASGAAVVAADINEAAARESCAMIGQAGGEAKPCVVDVGDEISVAAMVRFASVAVFIASKAGGILNGAVIPVDAGWAAG